MIDKKVQDIITKTIFKMADERINEVFSHIEYRIEQEKDPIKKRLFENALREYDYAMYHFDRANEYIEDVVTGRRSYHGKK